MSRVFWTFGFSCLALRAESQNKGRNGNHNIFGGIADSLKLSRSCQFLQNAIFQTRFRYANFICNLKKCQEAGEYPHPPGGRGLW